jgi:putative transposase
MPRIARRAPKGLIYHALNRAVARLPSFSKDADYQAFERVLAEAHERYPVEIMAYCVMPNHWHFVVRPTRDDQLTDFFRWLAHTHTMRWHAHYHTAGTGHLYQGRFKTFPVADDEHFYSVVRYVERNALRAGLVDEAGAWRWSSLWRRESGSAPDRTLLTHWPLPQPRNWREQVNAPQTEAELAAVRHAIQRGSPFGNPPWQRTAAQRLGLQSTLQPRGRPRKAVRSTSGK